MNFVTFEVIHEQVLTYCTLILYEFVFNLNYLVRTGIPVNLKLWNLS